MKIINSVWGLFDNTEEYPENISERGVENKTVNYKDEAIQLSNAMYSDLCELSGDVVIAKEAWDKKATK